MTTVNTKFFTFNQNNSGGSFVVSDGLAEYVIVEAIDAVHANARAQELGIYFNGCESGMDCDCCGDRWHDVRNDDGRDKPMIYDKAADDDFKGWFARPGQAYCHVHYLDGTTKTLKYKEAA